MSAQRIASRYAKSLIDLAVEQNCLEDVKGDLENFQSLVADSREFHLLLKSPIVSGTKKQAILKEAFEGKYNPLTLGFMNLMISKGREQYLAEAAQEFDAQYKSMKNISAIKLITATKMSDAEVEAIRQKMLSSTETASNVDITTEVNPDLIGGFVIEFDDKVYDASVAHKLAKLRKQFAS